MGKSQTIITKSAKETEKLGQELAASLVSQKEGSAYRTVCLYGDLGSGKTTLIGGMAKRFGLSTRFLSPTFIIVRRYQLLFPLLYFYHIDLYRICKEKEMQELGFPEIFADLKSVSAIEWAERLGGLFPARRIDVRMTMLDENKRKIEIQYV